MPGFLLLIQHAAGEAGQAATPFDINTGLILWTLLIFGVLLLLLWRFAWPPLVRSVEERERRIRLQIEEAERMNAEAKAALAEHKKLLAGARGEAQALLNEAKVVAQKEREQLLAKARDEQDQMLERAKREIQAERERAVQELRREAVDLSLAAAAKLIERRLDDEASRKLVADYLISLGDKH